MDLGEMLAQADDLELDRIKHSLIRERAIRGTMAESGESREIVVEMVDAIESTEREGVLELTDGQPTTLRAALEAYVHGFDHIVMTSRDAEVHDDLTSILRYPWRNEEAVIATHDDNQSLRLTFVDPDDGKYGPQVFVGGYLVGRLDGDEDVQGSVEMVEAVHRAVLARVIGDRDHHVQLPSTDRRSLMAWLERPNGSWRPDNRSRLTVDAVEGGGILVRTRAYRHPKKA